jgi:cysteine desulfurase/selenocysteine lyase
VIDAAQSAPHMRIDVQEIGCDFLAFSAHKLLGPMGVGVLYGRRDALDSLKPRDMGGGVVERVTARTFELRAVPARLEPGTPNVAGILGLGEAIRFLEHIGWQAIREHGNTMAGALRRGLGALRGVRLIASETALDALPIISLAVLSSAVRSDDLALALSDTYGVMTRSGRLCAHPLFDAVDAPAGALRVSAYVYNSLSEVDYLCRSFDELLTAFLH